MNRTSEKVLDELTLLQARSGDQRALAEVVKQWHPKLLRHALRLTQQPDAVADIVQDAWIAIVRGLDRLNHPAAFPRWAFQIVGNKSADWARRQKRRRVMHAKVAADTRSQQAVDQTDSLAELRSAIRQLSPEQRVVISQFYLDGHSTAEIADVLGIPPGTVKSRLHSTREKLKQILERTSHVEH